MYSCSSKVPKIAAVTGGQVGLNDIERKILIAEERENLATSHEFNTRIYKNKCDSYRFLGLQQV